MKNRPRMDHFLKKNVYRTVVHYAQEYNSKQFCAYDHGKEGNLASHLRHKLVLDNLVFYVQIG